MKFLVISHLKAKGKLKDCHTCVCVCTCTAAAPAVAEGLTRSRRSIH